MKYLQSYTQQRPCIQNTQSTKIQQLKRWFRRRSHVQVFNQRGREDGKEAWGKMFKALASQATVRFHHKLISKWLKWKTTVKPNTGKVPRNLGLSYIHVDNRKWNTCSAKWFSDSYKLRLTYLVTQPLNAWALMLENWREGGRGRGRREGKGEGRKLLGSNKLTI